MNNNLSEQEQVRRESLQKIKDLGINPYPAERFPVSHLAQNIKAEFTEENKDTFGDVYLGGRIMSRRIMGKASFAELQDSSGRIQLYLNRDEICPDEDKSLYNDVFKKLLDIGDFIGIRGYVFKTQVGETSVMVKELKLLSKSLRPLPIVKKDDEGNIHDAFTDPELRHRMRYVDLTVNPQYKEIFKIRAKALQSMRSFFDEKGWLEVETPILQSIHGGAQARPFATHHNALDIPLYLRIANELYLKRLIAGGFDGVYEIGKMFRNEGIDRTHNPEFTAMEIYIAYKDYEWMMNMVEECLTYIVQRVHGSTEIKLNEDTNIQFQAPFKRIPYIDAINEKVGIDVFDKNEEELIQICRQFGVDFDVSFSKTKLWDALFSELVEKELIQPTYIIDYPIEMSPLAKKHRSKAGLVERFELYINGKEIANAYSELNDPTDQYERFKQQLEESKKGDDEAMVMDYDFVRCLEFGMPPTSGLGIGIDRLVMLLAQQSSIQEVLFFPQMRPEKKTND